ncbi:MAG: hypothetical protein HWE20_07435 [Gammaproteobacteria bacterium]|nr:hypothetical protein [Gammaproteobacteria bacterium]
MKKSKFYRSLEEKVNRYGGYYNAHMHLDRVHTYDLPLSQKSEHLALSQKHSAISDIHKSYAYSTDILYQRMNTAMKTMIGVNTTRADSVIDISARDIGLRALEVAKVISDEHQSVINFRIGAYCPLGFEQGNSKNLKVLKKGIEIADFIGSLPERDDQKDYPTHIGFEESCRQLLELAVINQIEIQIHTDQVNHPNECYTERLLDVIENEGFSEFSKKSESPKIWVIHMISPSTYDEVRWNVLVSRLLDNNIGVICCPSAAIGMRQLRPILTPTFNSIARVLDLCAAGIQVRLGSDNVDDMLSPSTTADLTDEVFVLSAALRFYDVDLLAKLATGTRLDDIDRKKIQTHLNRDRNEILKAVHKWA